MATIVNDVNDPTLTTSLGGEPAADSDIVIGRYGINYTAATLANDMQSFTISPGFTGTFQASNGGQIVLTCNQTNTGRFRNEGNSPRVELTGTAGTGVIENIENRPVLAGAVLQVSGCNCESFYQQSGTAYVEATGDVNNIFHFGGASFWRQTAAATTFPVGAVVLTGGSMAINRDFGTADISDGKFTVESTHCTPTTVTIRGGGIFEVLDTGTIGTLIGYDGILDLRRLKRPVTFTNNTFYPGLEVWLSRSAGVTVTYSTPTLVAGGPKYVYFD